MNPAMKRILLVAIFLAFLAAGCIEQKDSDGDTPTETAGNDREGLIVTLKSPGSGEILLGDKDVRFDASARGGKSPYTYRWSSNIDGTLSTKESYQQNPSKLSKGEHNLILEVKDASGRSAQASVIIQVM
jgi:hypothetical protein